MGKNQNYVQLFLSKYKYVRRKQWFPGQSSTFTYSKKSKVNLVSTPAKPKFKNKAEELYAELLLKIEFC